MPTKLWLWRAWTSNKLIADCGIANAIDAASAGDIARMCLGGPLKNSVVKIDVEEVVATDHGVRLRKV